MNIIIIVTVVVLLILLVAAGMLVKFKVETSKMTPLDTGKVTDDIFVIRNDFVNMYLVKDEVL